MFCVLVGMLGGMLLGYASCFTGRSLSDPNCRLPRGPKSAPVSPQTNWVCWVSPPQEGKGSHQESNATVKTALVESTQHSSQLHWALLNSFSFLTALIQRSFLRKLSTERKSIEKLSYLLNCSEIPSSEKWWVLLLCTSQNTQTPKPPDVLLLWSSQCHSCCANTNTGDVKKSNMSQAKLTSLQPVEEGGSHVWAIPFSCFLLLPRWGSAGSWAPLKSRPAFASTPQDHRPYQKSIAEMGIQQEASASHIMLYPPISLSLFSTVGTGF